MSLLRPTLQARAGFNPEGHGPGVQSPFGKSPGYRGGNVSHNGQDYFWLGAASAKRLGISTAASKDVYPVMDGPVNPIDDPALGIGAWQQIDDDHRAYSWHMSKRIYNAVRNMKSNTRLGVMGSTGTAAGDDDHLHFEVRKAPYRPADRIDPEPFFAAKANGFGDAERKQIARYLNTHAKNLGLATTTTSTDGKPGGNYWKLVQGLGRAWGFYNGAVDGVPGAQTYGAEKHIWESWVKPKPVVTPPVVTPPVVTPPVVTPPVVTPPSDTVAPSWFVNFITALGAFFVGFFKSKP